MSFFSKIFGGDRKRYDKQKEQLLSADPAARAMLAQGEGTHPEILYYLARDKDAAVRKAVAFNVSTPVQASTLLATDENADVRLTLAARLVALLPDLSREKHSQLYAYAVQALGALAQDEVLKIRRALSSALKDCAEAPPKIAGILARDVEREVSEPILRHCAALSDEDLLSILASHPEHWVISAVAGRRKVSSHVSSAVSKTWDIPGNTTLLKNAGSELDEDTLRAIVDRAPGYPEWHEPLAGRRELSLDLATRLAGFVDDAVLAILQKRTDFEPAVRDEIAALVRRRIEYAKPGETPEERLGRYTRAGKLDAGVIADAIVWQDDAFVMLALAHHAGIHPAIARKMLRSGTPRPVIALCWLAKMPMRLAIVLQREFAKVRPEDMIYAKGGTDYPLSPEEIRWQLEFYGIPGNK